MKEKIGAVIVTRNRKKLLKECIDSLQKESIKNIIIIDNCSKDGTSEICKAYGKCITYIKNEENLGSAGGYNLGIKEAHKKGFDWVWLFDDDCEATKGSLKELKFARNILEKEGINVGFLSSRLIWLDEGCSPISIRFTSKTWAKYLNHSMIEMRWEVFTGLFVNMKAIISEGLPQQEFFICDDDTVFTYRITREYKGFLVGKSEVLHKDLLSKRQWYISLGASKENFKRYRYFARNGVYFGRVLLRSKEDKKLAVNQFIGIIKNILLRTLFSKNLIHFPILLWWFCKGLVFNPPLEKIQSKN